jgi:hypothetical protein
MSVPVKYHDIIADIPPSRRVKAEELCAKLAGGRNKGIVALLQLSRYRREPGKLGVPEHAFSAGLSENPIAWWANYGEDCTSLAAVAQRIDSIPVSSAEDERAFSAWKHIWSDKRSSLLVGRVGLLVYVYFNHRVLSRASAAATPVNGTSFWCC